MNPIQIHPMILTEDMHKTREFYKSIGGELMWSDEKHMCFCFGPKDQQGTISFYPPENKAFGIQQKAFGGEGLLLCIPAVNADAKCAEFKAAGIEILQEPRDREWRWRSFLIRDPNGVVLDFFEVLPNAETEHATS